MISSTSRADRTSRVAWRQSLWRAGIAGLALAIVTVSGAQAQSSRITGPSAEEGKSLAERLCATCHIVSPDANPATARPGIPSFPSIANKPDQTGDAISLTLINPHPPMTDPQLTRAEILHLLAYLETLRTVDGTTFLPKPSSPTRKPPPTEQPS